MKSNQRGFLSGYLPFIIGGLIITSGVLGYGLKKQIQHNGTLSAQNQQLEQSVLDAKTAYDALAAERRKSEVIVLDNLELKEVIYRDRDVIKYRVREVVKQMPAEDCANQPVNPDLLRLLDSAGSGDETRKDVPAPRTDPRHELTVDAR